MSIVTEYVAPPVPSSLYDWMAYVEGDEETTGRGPTEAEALRDLCAKLADLVRMNSWSSPKQTPNAKPR
jgi:hypothetical protein